MILLLLQPGQKVCKCSNKQFNILYSPVLISDFIFSKFSLFFHSFSFPLQMWLCRIYLHFRNWHSLSWIYWSLNSIPNCKLLERNLSAISGSRGEAQQWDPGVNTGHWRFCSWENITIRSVKPGQKFDFKSFIWLVLGPMGHRLWIMTGMWKRNKNTTFRS